MRNLKPEETVVVSGSDEGDNGIYYTQDGTPTLSPGLVGPPGHAPVVPIIPGWPAG